MSLQLRMSRNGLEILSSVINAEDLSFAVIGVGRVVPVSGEMKQPLAATTGLQVQEWTPIATQRPKTGCCIWNQWSNI